MTAGANPRVSTILLVLTWIEVFVVGAASILFLVPALIVPLWPWTLTPFNAFFVGATYLSAFVPLLIFALAGRWNPGRVVLPMIGMFTAYVLFASIIDPSAYLWDRFGTYLWWALYIILPVNSAVHLWLYRNWPAVAASSTPPVLRMVFIVQIALSLVIGLGLLLAPVATTTWWPWPIDAFNGRVYGAAFLAFPTASLMLFRRSSRHELIALGATSLTFGLAAVVGLVKTDIGLGRVNWSAPGTNVWTALFIVIALTGAVTLAYGVIQRQRDATPSD